jgi:dienelactone hydrolase
MNSQRRLLWFLSVPLFGIGLLAACCTVKPHSGSDHVIKTTPEERAKILQEFYCDPIWAETNQGRPVFRTPKTPASAPRPAVLLLHEFPYQSPQVFALAQRLAGDKFTVYVPTLYGEPMVYAPTKNFLHLAFSPDWNVIMSRHKTSPIAQPLRRMVAKISELHPGQPVHVVGMCLTGSLALVLGGEPAVNRVVAAQPATPMLAYSDKSRAALGISSTDWDAIKRKASDGKLQVLGLRFVHDALCPDQRFETLATDLGTAVFTRFEIRDADYDAYHIPRNAHPVLTYHVGDDDTSHPTLRAYRRMVDFLRGP